MNNIQKAFKKKDSMSLRDCYADGGEIEGPGTGTSDSVDIRASAGEYMLPADTVQAVGVPALDALRNATHMPVGAEGYANGGKIRPKSLREGYADGGLIDDDLERGNRLRNMARVSGIPQEPAMDGPRLRDMARTSGVPVPPPDMTGPNLRTSFPTAPTPEAAGAGLRNSAFTPPNLPRLDPAVLAETPRMPAAQPGILSRSFNYADDAVNRVGAGFRGMGQAVSESLPGRAANWVANTGAGAAVGKYVGDPLKAVGGFTMKKFLPAVGAGYSGAAAVDSTRRGDAIGAVDNGVDTVASGALLTPAAPVAGAYLGGKAVGSVLRNSMAPGTQDNIGGTINQGIRDMGSALGKDWGYDDSRHLQLQAQDRLRAAQPQAAAPAPTTNTGVNARITAFQDQYGAAAQRAADQLGVDPKMLLAQWAGETGWGRHVIPGTNNLGNIKDFTGGGVSATDNMNGSVDKYRKFATPEEFADHYVGLMQRKYPGVQGAGSDIGKFTAGLKGYAEDPQYASKIDSIYKRLGGIPGQGASAQTPEQNAKSLRDGYDTVEVIKGMDRSYTHFKKDGDQFAPGVTTNSPEPPGPMTPQVKSLRDAMQAGVDPRDLNQANANQESAESNRLQRESLGQERQRQQANTDETQGRMREAEARQAAKGELDARRAASDQMKQDIQSRNTVQGAKGPTFDANKVGEQIQHVEKAMATMGAKSWDDLDQTDRDRVFAASELLQKVGADATGLPVPDWIAPDQLGTVDPTDLFGLKPQGDNFVTRSGKVIPGRYLKKEKADRLGGTPTNRFDVLIRK